MNFSWARNMRICARIHLISGGALLALAVLGWLFLSSLAETLRTDRAEQTRHLVESAHTLLVHFAAEELAGHLDHFAAQAAALSAVRSLRYDDKEYFWINDMQCRMVMHPVQPELDGKDMTEFKDPTGKRLFVEAVETVRRSGAGFIGYMWPKPGSDQPVEKISYVKGFAPWGWVVGSGVYVDDLNAAVRAKAIGTLEAVGAILALLALLSALVGRGITRPLTAMTAFMATLASGDTVTAVPGSERGD